MKSGFSAVIFDTLFTVGSQLRTSQTWKIIKHQRNLDVRKYFFSEWVVDRWNKLEQTDTDFGFWKHQRFQEQIRRNPEDEEAYFEKKTGPPVSIKFRPKRCQL